MPDPYYADDVPDPPLPTPRQIIWAAAGGLVELTARSDNIGIVFRPGKPPYGGRRQVSEEDAEALLAAIKVARTVATALTVGGPVEFAAWEPAPNEPPW